MIGALIVAANVNILDLDSNNSDIEKGKQAEVTMVQAINKVTAIHKGVVITATLEEKEGEGFVYEIDLVQDGKEVEVWVNAKTGQVSELMAD